MNREVTVLPWHQSEKLLHTVPLGHDGSHAAILLDEGTHDILKVFKRKNPQEVPHECLMEIVSRDCCAHHCPAMKDNDRILPITEVIELPDAYALRSPYLKGGDLFCLQMNLINKEVTLQAEQVSKIIHDFLIALAVMHASGVAHRDVKDSNVLIGENNSSALLCDMSLASCVPSFEGDHFLPYTTGYQPPEVIAYGRRNYEGDLDWIKCDIYATGVTLAKFILVFATQWDSASSPKRVQFLEKCPDSIASKAAVSAMMDEDPLKRPSIIDVLTMFNTDVPPCLSVYRRPKVISDASDFLDAVQKWFDWDSFSPSWLTVATDLFRTLNIHHNSARERKVLGIVCTVLSANACLMCSSTEILPRDNAAFVDSKIREIVKNPSVITALYRTCCASRFM